MTEAGKLKMARALAALRVDVIEAGFAAASPGDFRAVDHGHRRRDRRADHLLARPRDARRHIGGGDVAAGRASRKRVHVFLGTSPIHREAKLHMDKAQVLAAIRDSVAYARELAEDVEFSAEDAIRTERDFLIECLSAGRGGRRDDAQRSGHGRLHHARGDLRAVPPTWSVHVDHGPDVIFSTHCHDDLGMAVANSLAAVRGGARQVECAMNGIGERAGNCALEDVVMALKTRSDTYGVSTGVDTTKIMAASRTLAQITNVPPPRNKAIVGANAFAHEAGIHQHGVLQNRETYEIMKPEDIGLATDGIVLGKHSGRHALVARAKALGYVLEGEALDRAFAAFKEIADEVGIVDTARLVAMLASMEGGGKEKPWSLSKVEIRAPVTVSAWPVARVELEHGHRGRVCDLASAPGALDAAFKAVSQIIGVPARVEELDMQYIAADPGEAAQDDQGANVLVEIQISVDGEIFAGRARARDILPSCVAAYIDAASNAEAVRPAKAA